MKVLLKYGFIFEPTETWTQTSQFESMLSKYFDQLGLDAEVIRTDGDEKGMRMIFLAPNNKPAAIAKVNGQSIDKERKKNGLI